MVGCTSGRIGLATAVRAVVCGGRAKNHGSQHVAPTSDLFEGFRAVVGREKFGPGRQVLIRSSFCELVAVASGPELGAVFSVEPREPRSAQA